MERITPAKSDVILILTKEEAKWLHQLVHTPLRGEDITEESVEDSRMRSTFFHATKNLS